MEAYKLKNNKRLSKNLIEKLILLCAALLALTVPAAAEEFEVFSLDAEQWPFSGNDAAETLGAASYDGLYEAMVKGFENIDEEIDISSLNLTFSDKDEFQNISEAMSDIYTDVILNNPRLFYIDELNVVVTVYKNSYLISALAVDYLYSPEEIKEKQAFVDAEAGKILALADDSMTDLEKALLVHDHIVTNYEYDYDLAIRDIYGFFSEKKGVCQAYTLAYEYIMGLMGIDCVPVASKAMEHVWNAVKINGEWYHADLTFDDPNVGEAGDSLGYCSHTYFLCSDSYMLVTGEGKERHRDWVFSEECGSELYDNAFWRGYKTAFAFKNGEWYVAANVDAKNILRREICTADVNAGSVGAAVYSFTASSAPSSWYTSPYSFNIAVYGDYLLYNSDSAVYLLNTDSWQARRLPIKVSAQIHGITAFDGRLFCAVGDTHSDSDVLVWSLAELVADASDGTDGEASITEATVSSGVLTAKIELTDACPETSRVYVAAFDGFGNLISAQSLPAAVDIEAEVPDAASYRVFLWDGAAPLCESVSAVSDK